MNIYVGNLPYKVVEDELKGIFEENGEVTSVKIIKDRVTNRSKGFAFVEMPNQDEATNAIQELDEAELVGRNIRVNEAKERPNRNTGSSRPNYERRSYNRE